MLSTTAKSPGRNILWYSILPVIVLIVIPVAMTVVLALQVWNWFLLRRYCWTNKQWTYLICSGKRNWNSFVENNLLPAMPAAIAPVWFEEKREGEHVPRQSLLYSGAGLTKPYLAKITLLGIRSKSLHRSLFSLKARGKASENVQQEIRGILEAEIA